MLVNFPVLHQFGFKQGTNFLRGLFELTVYRQKKMSRRIYQTTALAELLVLAVP